MCKKTSTGFCMPPQYREYEKLAIPLIKIINSKKSPKPDKTQASEMLGTLAAIAYNARRLGITFSKSQAEHQEFSASGVFDLVMKCKNGDIEWTARDSRLSNAPRITIKSLPGK